MSDSSNNWDPSAESSSWLISVLFWSFLLCAVGLYAIVALAPKVWTHMKLKAEYYTNYAQAKALQERINFLKKVAAALKTDPEFRAEYARLDLVQERPKNGEYISVQKHLAWDARKAEMLPQIRPRSLPWYAPLIKQLAFNWYVRRTVLLAAAAIMLLSFGFLHESQRQHVLAAQHSLRTLTHSLLQRYQKTSSSPTKK